MQQHIATRKAHIASATPGMAAARVLTDITDEAVRELSRAASSLLSKRWAIVALGSWGSRAMLPASDLDILVLSEANAATVKPFVEALLYPLWDSGLAVGHQVRSSRQQLQAMRDDLKTCTAALTARPIAGDLAWAQKVLADCVRTVAKRPEPLLAQLAARPRPGTPYLLEPDLKDGAGGRRDFDELTWSAALLGGSVEHSPGALVDAGVLTSTEFERLTACAETIAAARWELQAAGQGDRMTLDALEALVASDAEVVQAALGDTALLLALARGRIAGADATVDATLCANDVLELVAAGDAERLELAAQASALEGLVPGYRDLMSCRRPGLGHELTVGAHCIKAATGITTLDRVGALGRSLESQDDPRITPIAALVHDVGKATGGAGHAEAGAPLARQAALAFGLTTQDADTVADLVRLHLLLPETALRENLDDEDTILRCAGTLGSAHLLAPLHVLTAVDSLATGPSTWTPWTAALVGTLVGRLDAALSDDVDGAGLAARGEITRREALALIAPTFDAERAFVEGASLRYLASRTPKQAAADARLVSDLASTSGSEAVGLAVTAGPSSGTYVITIAAPDRTALLAMLAGALSLAGLDILSVDAYETTGGIALDSFTVVSATRRPVTTETFSAVERFVRAALRDRLELAMRLEQRRHHYPPRAKGATKITTSTRGWDTAVQVTTPDRPGLLHDIARAVSATGLDIRWTRAQTVDGMARDTFHVVGADGGPVSDPGVIGHLVMNIRGAV